MPVAFDNKIFHTLTRNCIKISHDGQSQPVG